MRIAVLLVPALFLCCATATIPVYEQARVRDGTAHSVGLRAESALMLYDISFVEGTRYYTRFLSGVANYQVSSGSGWGCAYLRLEAGPSFALVRYPKEHSKPAGVLHLFPWGIVGGGKFFLAATGTAIKVGVGGPWTLAELALLQDIGRNWTVTIGTSGPGLVSPVNVNAGVAFHHRFGSGLMGHISLAGSGWPTDHPEVGRPYAASLGIALEWLPGPDVDGWNPNQELPGLAP